MKGLQLHYLIIFIFFTSFCEARDSRIRISVVDTGIRMSSEIKPYLCREAIDVTGKGLYDVHGHGTNVAHILSTYINPKRYCLYIIKWYHRGGKKVSQKLIRNTIDAVTQSGARYVNMSLSGDTSNWYEKLKMGNLLDRGVVIAVAAGNEGYNLSKECEIFPGCYGFKHSNFFVIGGSHRNRIVRYFNYGGPVDAYEESKNVVAGGVVLSGTSQATPIFLGKYIRKRSGRKPATHTWGR